MSNTIEIVNTTPFNMPPEAYNYFIYPLQSLPIVGNYVFNLCPVNNTLKTITIINNSINNVVVMFETTTIDTLSSGQSAVFIPNTVTNNWVEIISSSVVNANLNIGNALIPKLSANTNFENKDFWSTTGNNAQAGSDYFNPMSGNGGFWGPAAPDPAQYLQISSQFASIAKGFSIIFKDTNSVNYFANTTIGGSNDSSVTATYTTLYTFTNAQTQSGNFQINDKFTNTTSYLYYRITIGNVVGNILAIGVNMFQLYGYYNLG